MCVFVMFGFVVIIIMLIVAGVVYGGGVSMDEGLV